MLAALRTLLAVVFAVCLAPTAIAAKPIALVTECDRLAASPDDPSRPAGMDGVEFPVIDPVKAIPACRAALAASPNDPRVAFQLAVSLHRGGMLTEAYELYRRAAEAGHALGMTRLGNMYENGDGVPKDMAEAVRWYRKAAVAGDTVAMAYLGLLYEEGRGVPKSKAEAKRWYRKAAALGYEPAKDALAGLAPRRAKKK
jgi:hypothetical protein